MQIRRSPARPSWLSGRWFGVCVGAVSLAVFTLLAAPFAGDDDIGAVSMLLLVIVLAVSAVWGYLAGLVSAVLADALLNFFFVPPLHTFVVGKPRDIVALVAFLAVALMGSAMLSLLRRQLAVAAARQAELGIMLKLSRDLASASTPEWALDALAHSVRRAVQARRCDILRPAGNGWQSIASTGTFALLSRDGAALANLAVKSGQVTRSVTDDQTRRASTLRIGRQPVSDTFLPFRSAGGESGVIHILGPLTAPEGGDLDALLRAFADEAGVALHRAHLAEQTRHAEVIERSDKFKSVLLSSVSHDLRSPLTAIKAAVGSLRSADVGLRPTDRAQLLEIIESQTDRLAATVSDLLDMSRLEGGSVRPHLEPVEVRPLLYDAIAAARTVTADRAVSVDVLSPIWVRADYGLLLQAVANLIENASKYSTPGGSIAVGAESGGGRVTLSVSDEGPGIAPEDLPHIFEKFYRGALGKKVPGSGLGLSIVRAMVELCGGRVTVESSARRTTFRIGLPPAGPPR